MRHVVRNGVTSCHSTKPQAGVLLFLPGGRNVLKAAATALCLLEMHFFQMHFFTDATVMRTCISCAKGSSAGG